MFNENLARYYEIPKQKQTVYYDNDTKRVGNENKCYHVKRCKELNLCDLLRKKVLKMQIQMQKLTRVRSESYFIGIPLKF